MSTGQRRPASDHLYLQRTTLCALFHTMMLWQDDGRRQVTHIG